MKLLCYRSLSFEIVFFGSSFLIIDFEVGQENAMIYENVLLSFFNNLLSRKILNDQFSGDWILSR